MKILIIGSKGFIGSHLYNDLKKEYVNTFAADVAVDYGNPNYYCIDASNSDFSDIFQSINFDFCINCSGAASVPDSISHPLRDFNLNTVNVFKILDSIRKYNSECRLINLSSAAVYGNPKSLPIKENNTLLPVSPYGFHKKYAEEIINEYQKIFNIHACSLRIFSAYGEGLKKQILWDIYKKSIENNQSISLFGTGSETRDYIYISDIIQAIKVSMFNAEFKGEAYNVANGRQISIKTIAECLLSQLNYKGDVIFSGQERIGDPAYWVADITKITNLGYIQKTDLVKGINNYTKWLKELK